MTPRENKIGELFINTKFALKVCTKTICSPGILLKIYLFTTKFLMAQLVKSMGSEAQGHRFDPH